MKSTSSLRYKPRYSENPFVDDHIRMIVPGRSHEYVHLESLTNQDGVPHIVRHQVVDEEKFVKIYIAYMDVWMGLSKKAQKVLQYVFKSLKPNKDKVEISIEGLSDFTGYNSYGPLYSGLNELIEAQLLCRTRHELIYYINPKFVFNGNRLRLGEELLRKEILEQPMTEEESYELPEGFDEEEIIDV